MTEVSSLLEVAASNLLSLHATFGSRSLEEEQQRQEEQLQTSALNAGKEAPLTCSLEDADNCTTKMSSGNGEAALVVVAEAEPIPSLSVELPTQVDEEEAEKVERRGAHWKYKRNTDQAPKPYQWTHFWGEQRMHIQGTLTQYFVSHPSVPILRTLPWDSAIGGYAMGNQRKFLWMYLYYCHLKGTIRIDFVPEFFTNLTATGGAAAVVAPEARRQFDPVLPRDTTTSFFGIQGFEVLDLAEFNAHWLIPMPSGYFDDQVHTPIGADKAMGRHFGRKAVVRTWYGIGMKETSHTRMVFEYYHMHRIKEAQAKQLFKRAGGKRPFQESLVPQGESQALGLGTSTGNDGKHKKTCNNLDGLPPATAVAVEPLDAGVLEATTMPLPLLAVMMDDVRSAEDLVQMAFAHLRMATHNGRDVLNAERILYTAIKELETARQNLERTRALRVTTSSSAEPMPAC